MKAKRLVLFSLVLGIIFTVTSLARYEFEDVPDLTMIRYGFPLVWLSHQTMSIAGPTNVWSFDWTSLILDFTFWYLISIILVYAWYKIKSDKASKKNNRKESEISLRITIKMHRFMQQYPNIVVFYRFIKKKQDSN